jgi:ABC-2 type transport system ATP-binding protein
LSDPVLVLDGVAKQYRDVEALRDLTFSVGRGEMFGLIGPDGAGKTRTGPARRRPSG